MQLRERRIARTKIIHCNAESGAIKCVQLLDGMGGIVHGNAFGHFQYNVFRAQAALFQLSQQLLGQVGRKQLALGNVDGKVKALALSAPGLQRIEGL